MVRFVALSLGVLAASALFSVIVTRNRNGRLTAIRYFAPYRGSALAPTAVSLAASPGTTCYQFEAVVQQLTV